MIDKATRTKVGVADATDVPRTFQPVQLSTDIRIHSKYGVYRLTPLPTITAYQSLRITMLMFAVAASHGGAIDDAWEATHGETAEHWTRIE